MGYKLRELRTDQHMTQEELSAKSGISRQTIISIENDECYNTTTETLLKLADALGVTIDNLFLK